MTNCSKDCCTKSLWKKLTEHEPPEKKVLIRRSIDGEPFTYDMLFFERVAKMSPHKYHPDFYRINHGFAQVEDVNYPEYIEWIDPEEIS